MTTAQSSQKTRLTIGALALVLSAALLVLWWIITKPPPSGDDGPPRPPIPPGLSKTDFYKRELVPLLDRARNENRKNAENAVGRLNEEFDRFRSGIPAFVDDLTTWGTRFGIVRRMTKDKWTNFWKNETDPDSTAVKQYVLGKFESHIMSQGSLQKAVKSAIGQFNDDATASRNQLLSEVKLALTTGDMKLDFPKPDFEAFQNDFDKFVADKVADQGTDSLENAIVAFIASNAATVAAEQLVVQILGLVSAEAVVVAGEEAAVAGSSMAGGGTLGAAAGWLGGPAGVAIGVGAGLAIGAIVDWWITEKFSVNLTQELTTYLNNLERDLIDGVPPTGDEPQRAALRETFHRSVNDIHSMQSLAVQKALTEIK